MKRYNITTDIAFREWEDEDPNGRWVKFEDAHARVAELEAFMRRATDANSYLTDLASANSELTKLRAVIAKVQAVCDSRPPDNDPEYMILDDIEEALKALKS